MNGLMLDGSGKSGLKAIVAQCLSSMIRMAIVTNPIEKEKMFDLDLYQHTIDEKKRDELKRQFENDPYLKYLVEAIKHAVGADHESVQHWGDKY